MKLQQIAIKSPHVRPIYRIWNFRSNWAVSQNNGTQTTGRCKHKPAKCHHFQYVNLRKY